ncbi:MAG: 1-acyl-sn-glycerol-3-phosphate acyltransferase [Oscillospiraceae bacterium]|nr:1-acyl-sn-glycerol-3-phosphate acyltransferase [Oscillospiraceae bacterium]
MAAYIFSLVLGLFFSVLEVLYLGWDWKLLIFIPLTIAATVIAVFLVFIVTIWIISLFIDMEKKYDAPTKFYMELINFAFTYLLLILGVRVKLEGGEKVPTDKRFLVVSNHVHAFDPLFVILSLRNTWVSYVSKPENFKIPIIGRYMHRCLHLPIDRDNPRNALLTINEAADQISRGAVSMGIFPEGTRSKTGELGEFRNGAFKIAQKAKCPVVVAAIKNSRKAARRPFVTVTVKIAGVLPYGEIAEMRTAEISSKVREMILTA